MRKDKDSPTWRHRKKAYCVRTIHMFLLVLLVLGTFHSIRGEESLLYACPFDCLEDLKGWRDAMGEAPQSVGGDSVLNKQHGHLRIVGWRNGISHPLDHACTINDKVEQIIIQIDVFNPQESTDDNVLSVGLSSREKADHIGNNHMPCDSGIAIEGCAASIQRPNSLVARKEGCEIWARKPTMPFNLLPSNGRWITWRLMYDHAHKNVRFFNGTETGKEAVTELHYVDMSGVTFRSVWIGGTRKESCYRNLKVTCKIKK